MTVKRKLLRDFTIVVAVVACLAAWLWPDLSTAIQRSKQKRTYADMRDWGIAIENHAVKHGSYPRPGYNGPVASLASEIGGKLPPPVDAWGHPILYHGSARHYALRSTARDGRNDHRIERAQTKDFDDDALLVDGGFVRVTEGMCGGTDGRDDWDVKKYGECSSCHPHRIQHS